MVVAHHHPDDVGRYQTDKTDQTHIRNHHGAGQAAKHHAHKGQALYIDTKADCRFLAA